MSFSVLDECSCSLYITKDGKYETYPNIFAASDTEPSTAKNRSSNACIPCTRKLACYGSYDFNRFSSQYVLYNLNTEENSTSVWLQEYQGEFWIVWTNLRANISSPYCWFCRKNLKKFWRRCVTVQIYRVSD